MAGLLVASLPLTGGIAGAIIYYRSSAQQAIKACVNYSLNSGLSLPQAQSICAQGADALISSGQLPVNTLAHPLVRGFMTGIIVLCSALVALVAGLAGNALLSAALEKRQPELSSRPGAPIDANEIELQNFTSMRFSSSPPEFRAIREV